MSTEGPGRTTSRPLSVDSPSSHGPAGSGSSTGGWDETTADARNRILQGAVLIAIAAALAQGVVHLVNVLALDDRWWQLNADQDGNIFSWASASATFAAATVAALGAIGLRLNALRLGLLSALLAYLSVDDMIALHERFAARAVQALGLQDYLARDAWPVIYLPILAAAAGLIWITVRAEDGQRRLVVIAFALLALAIALEGLGSFLDIADRAQPTDTLNALEVAFEESLELAAWILIAGALAACLVRDIGRIALARTRVDSDGDKWKEPHGKAP